MKRILTGALFLGFILSGCATTSPYVGSWRSGELPESAAIMNLIINKDGTLSFMLDSENDSEDEYITGTWKILSEERIQIDIPGQKSGTGEILDKDTMQIIGDDDIYKMTRN